MTHYNHSDEIVIVATPDILPIVELTVFQKEMVTPLFTSRDLKREIIKVAMAYRSSMRKERYYELRDMMRRSEEIADETIAAEIEFMTKWIEHGHISPFKHGTLSFDLKLSLSAFAHLGKHGTFMPTNSRSYRYTDIWDAKYLFDDTIFYKHPLADQDSIRQSNDAEIQYFEVFKKSINEAKANYAAGMKQLKSKSRFAQISKTEMQERCRQMLPSCLITETMVSPSLLSFCNMAGQRLSVHAQTEIRLIVGEMMKSVKGMNPEFHKLLETIATTINHHTLGDDSLLYGYTLNEIVKSQNNNILK